MFKDAQKYLGFDDRWLMAMGIPFCAIVVELMIFGKHLVCQNLGYCTFIALLFTIGYWFIFRQTIISYHKSFPGYDFNSERLLYIGSRLIVGYLIVKFGLGYIIEFAAPDHAQFYEENKLSPFIPVVSEMLMIGLFFFVYEGIYYFNRSRLIEIEKNELEKITAEQKLSTLKNQVNPHFLFNSLNTVVTMIPEEPNMAIKFVQKLSKTYRNILELRDEKLISISEELNALDSYIFLLKTRFQGKIHIYNSIEEDMQGDFILPLSLQILIENAVKHNVTSSAKPLTIKIFIEDEHIVVRNNLQKKDQQYNSTKMGLENIRSRYKLIAERSINVEESDEYFTVKLPLIKNSVHAHTVS